MATSHEDYVEKIKGLFGVFRDPDTQDINDRTRNMVGDVVPYQNNNVHSTATNLVEFKGAVFVAPRACRLVTASYKQDASVTASNTDHFLLTLVKKPSSTFSATSEMARLAGTVTTSWTGYLVNNKADASNEFALHSTSTNFELAAGDVVLLKHSHVGDGGVSLVPTGTVFAEFA